MQMRFGTNSGDDLLLSSWISPWSLLQVQRTPARPQMLHVCVNNMAHIHHQKPPNGAQGCEKTTGASPQVEALVCRRHGAWGQEFYLDLMDGKNQRIASATLVILSNEARDEAVAGFSFDPDIL